MDKIREMDGSFANGKRPMRLRVRREGENEEK